MFKIYITNLGKYNEGKLIGEWLELPATEDELQESLNRIGINEEYEEFFITDFENSYNYTVGEYENINDLNELADTLEYMDEYDKTKLSALLEFENDINYAISQIDNATLYEGVTTHEELGHYCHDNGLMGFEMPSNIESYFDFESYGRDYEINSTGGFCKEGFLTY
jgi:antirestriction protein